MYDKMREVDRAALGRRARTAETRPFLCPPFEKLTVLGRFESPLFKYVQIEFNGCQKDDGVECAD